jgi:dinuclear metal center YbgI/SA1388 family protein
MLISEIVNSLEAWAPPAYQESYDNSGLLCGDYNWLCHGALCTLDCTEEVIDEAVTQGCNLIIAHHPIIFKGLKQLIGKNYVERTIIKAIKNDIAIYAIHTNLDNVHTGVSNRMAELLNLTNMRTLAPKDGLLQKLTVFVPKENSSQVEAALFKAGAGTIGNYSECSFKQEGTGSFKPNAEANPTIGSANQREFVQESRIEVLVPAHRSSKILQAMRAAHPYEEVAYFLQPLANYHQEVGSGQIGELPNALEIGDFIELVKEKFEVPMLKYTPLKSEKKIKKVALCGGAGSFLIKVARASGADAYITADIKYHEFFDAEGQLLVVDIGHYESEACTKGLIAEHMRENFPNIATYISQTVTNPVCYL